MARRKKKVHENYERWLVSYADLLTLLFAFFVVMFASSHTDFVRARQISRAVDKAFQTSVSPQVAAILGGRTDDNKDRGNTQLKGPVVPLHGKVVEEPALQLDLTTAVQALRSTLGSEMKENQVQVHMEQRGAVISLNAQSVFPSGGDTIDPAILPLLAKIAATLNTLPNPIRLEGHTDSRPISSERFRSNWELSSARSIAMLRVLEELYGVSRSRMAIVGYGDTNAIGDNQTEEGRARNRRVDLVILSDFGKHIESGPTLPAH